MHDIIYFFFSLSITLSLPPSRPNSLSLALSLSRARSLRPDALGTALTRPRAGTGAPGRRRAGSGRGGPRRLCRSAAGTCGGAVEARKEGGGQKDVEESRQEDDVEEIQEKEGELAPFLPRVPRAVLPGLRLHHGRGGGGLSGERRGGRLKMRRRAPEKSA